MPHIIRETLWTCIGLTQGMSEINPVTTRPTVLVIPVVNNNKHYSVQEYTYNTIVVDSQTTVHERMQVYVIYYTKPYLPVVCSVISNYSAFILS